MPLDVVSQHEIEAKLLHRSLPVSKIAQQKVFRGAVPHLSHGIQPFPHLADRQVGNRRRHLALLFFFPSRANGHFFFLVTALKKNKKTSPLLTQVGIFLQFPKHFL
jgi:hypothetical protein